ncbi:MAG: aldo/keto reductase, partial [Nitrosopumilus sp.]|nr:aldo/keto reductase [Nitrosopumilus sp.]
DNGKVFDLKIEQDDILLISAVTAKANDLFDVIGDCGDEYR